MLISPTGELRQAVPRTFLQHGDLFAYYAGPFKTETRAWDYIESCYADGTLSISDRPTVNHGAVYVLA